MKIPLNRTTSDPIECLRSQTLNPDVSAYDPRSLPFTRRVVPTLVKTEEMTLSPRVKSLYGNRWVDPRCRVFSVRETVYPFSLRSVDETCEGRTGSSVTFVTSLGQSPSRDRTVALEVILRKTTVTRTGVHVKLLGPHMTLRPSPVCSSHVSRFKWRRDPIPL